MREITMMEKSLGRNMTKDSGEDTRQSLSKQQENRGAAFVPTKSEEKENFKYVSLYKIKHRASDIFISWKRRINSIRQKPGLWTNNIKWDRVRRDSLRWLIEAFVEGLTANFATWQLLGFGFDPLTILAHGIVIKQGLSIVWRLRYGPTSKLPEKDE